MQEYQLLLKWRHEMEALIDNSPVLSVKISNHGKNLYILDGQ